MFSVKSFAKKFGLAAAAAGMTLGMAGAAQAGVVIKSSGPSAAQFPVGKKVDDRGRITLKSGDSVTVLANGQTRVISGAGTHRIAARGKSKRSAFSILTKQRSSARGGASRSGQSGADLVRSNIWHVDVSQSGTMCVSDLSAVRMWRPGFEQGATYVVASASSPEHVHVAFAEEIMITDWDTARMPLADGAAYSITGPGGEAADITFVQLETTPDTPEALAEAFIANGCSGQLELLANTLM